MISKFHLYVAIPILRLTQAAESAGRNFVPYEPGKTADAGTYYVFVSYSIITLCIIAITTYGAVRSHTF